MFEVNRLPKIISDFLFPSAQSILASINFINRYHETSGLQPLLRKVQLNSFVDGNVIRQIVTIELRNSNVIEFYILFYCYRSGVI